jgi:hypothetical protein
VKEASINTASAGVSIKQDLPPGTVLGPKSYVYLATSAGPTEVSGAGVGNLEVDEILGTTLTATVGYFERYCKQRGLSTALYIFCPLLSVRVVIAYEVRDRIKVPIIATAALASGITPQ